MALTARVLAHKMQISLMLRALEEKAMITRVRSRQPAIAKRVEITSSGLASLRIAMPITIAVQREMFGADGENGGPLLCALRRVEIGNKLAKAREYGTVSDLPGKGVT